jgi:translocation and assembly module TamB
MRWLRRLAVGLVALVLIAGLLAFVADTDIGHRFIANRVAALSPKSGLKIRIGRIDGSIYGKARLRQLELSDPKGRFFEAPDVTLHWSPLKWLSNELDIDRLEAPNATLLRLPKLNPSPKQGPILPGFDIRVGHFAINRLVIAQGVAGGQRIGRVEGKADVRGGHAIVHLDADAAQGDRLTIALNAEPDRDRFDAEGQLDAPAGGVFGALIGTQRPVNIRLTGDGHWKDWRGGLAAIVSGGQFAKLSLTQQSGRYALDGQLVPAPLLKGKLQRLTSPVVRVRGDATLANRRLDGRLTLASSSLRVDGDGIIDLATSSFDDMMVNASLLQPPALFPNMTGTNVVLKARLDGPFSTASFDYLLTAPRVAFDQTGFDDVRASGQGRLSKAPVRVPVRLTARRVTGVGDVAGGILANLSVDGLLLVTGKAITGDGLILKSDKLSGKLTLFVDLVTGRYDIGLAGQLVRYLIPGLGIVDVKSELKAVPGLDGHGTRILGRGQAWVRRFDNSFLAGLAGGLPQIDTGLERGPDGILHLINLKLAGPAIRITGNGYRRRDGSFFFEGTGQQAKYGPITLKLDGRIEKPKLDIQLASPNKAMGLTNVHLLLDPDPQGFVWAAQGGSTLGPFNGKGLLALPRGSPAVIGFADLNVSGMRGKGSLAILPGGFDGELAVQGSGISGLLAFEPAGTIQRIRANLVARDARLEGPPLISARRGQFDGVILLDPAGTSIEGTLTGQGLQRGPLTLARLAANINLKGGVGEVRASFAGERGRSFDFQTLARGGRNQWTVVGSGTIDRKPIQLTSPAVLTREGDGWRMQPATLAFGGGSARVGGHFGGAAPEIDANVSRMPMAILDMFYPKLGLGGLASGTIAYRQPGVGAPSGKADLKIIGLSRSGLVLSSRPVDLGLAAVLNGNRAGARMVAVSGGETLGRAQVQMANISGGGDLFARLAAAPMQAQLRYNGAADTLWRLTGVETFDLSGAVAVGADISGTPSNPQIRGSLRTTNARVESAATGMVLTGVQASGSFGGSRLVIDRFSANAGRDGSVTGRGSFDFTRLSNGVGIDIDMQANRAQLIARDDLGATVTGPLSIKSDDGSGIISGRVTLDASRFRLGRATAAAGIPRLKVRELNSRPDQSVARTPPRPWRLNVSAKAPSRLLVTGLGIESEWRADLDIGGTIYAPALVGRADLLRGGYEFAGRRFDLSRGTIRFQGASPPDPILDIVAQGNTQGLNATITVSGTGQRPDINFASVPALPQDELLSRLLFGTSITNLSAPEAVQLASAVAALRDGGNGLNPINAVRQAIGLDRLRILPADTTTGQRTAVAAGKYLNRRTYVEIITDGQGYSATRAEFQVTRWLSLLSSISTIGRQSATVRISKDY